MPKMPDMPKDTLWSTINTPAIEKRIAKAATSRFPRQQRSLFFEHGHWWLRITGKGDEDDHTFDVVDAEDGQSINGFDFEEV